jgi:hypothetical protein
MVSLLTLSSAFGAPVAALAPVVHKALPQRRAAGSSQAELEYLQPPSSLPLKRGRLELHRGFSALVQAGSRRMERCWQVRLMMNDCRIYTW